MKLEGKFDRPGSNDSLLAQSGVGGKGGKWRHSLFIGSLGLLSLCVTYSSHPQGWVSWKTIFPCPLQCSCLENPRDTTVYFATGDKIFLICFNDTCVNDDISKIIEKTPQQTMSHDDFSSRLNQALSDYQDQLSQEDADLREEQYQRNNQPTNRFFFWFH